MYFKNSYLLSHCHLKTVLSKILLRFLSINPFSTPHTYTPHWSSCSSSYSSQMYRVILVVFHLSQETHSPSFHSLICDNENRLMGTKWRLPFVLQLASVSGEPLLKLGVGEAREVKVLIPSSTSSRDSFELGALLKIALLKLHLMQVFLFILQGVALCLGSSIPYLHLFK